MTEPEEFELRDADIASFHRDGAMMLKGVLNDTWLQMIADGMELCMSQPTSRSKDYARDDATGQRFFHDALPVTHVPNIQRYVTESPIGKIAARIMGSPTALAFYATVFIRSPGTQAPTPWHQDLTTWSAECQQGLSIWTSLDPVPAGTALEIVLGSHKWDRPLQRPFFEDRHLGGIMEIDDFQADPIPDFSGADSDKYDVVGWPMEPGDILLFHGRTVHGGSGNLPEGLGRRALSVQWLGEHAQIVRRPGGCDPDWLPELQQHGLDVGDYPACAMCPVIQA